MHCSTVDLEALDAPRGAVVVIDVVRACTTAAAAVAAGATEVVVAGTVEAAFALRERLGAPIAGEVEGFPVDGFDFTNSPVDVAAAPGVRGRPLVLRTTSGTQGLLRARGAELVLAAGFVTASATVAALRAAAPAEVTFVVTGSRSADRGEEDRALADYLAASLDGVSPDPRPYLDRARDSVAGRRFATGGDLAAFAGDLDACLVLDGYAFALRLAGGDPPRLVAVRGRG